MNDEIKEILNIINYKYKDYYVQDIVSGDDLKLLSDCITNLQEENQRLKNREKELKYFNDILENKEVELLKENHELKETIEELKSKNDILKFRMKQNDKMVICERYRILKQRDDYKQRVDKAIEYIKSPGICIDIRKTDGTLDFVSTDELLNILNGGDE